MVMTLQRKSATNLELSPITSAVIARSNQPVYAFLAVQGHFPTEIVSEERDRQALYMYELGFDLAQRGCQVDIFVRRDNPYQPEIVEHQPGLRTICLTAGPAMIIPRTQVLACLPAFVDAWLAFQRHSDRNYKLFQTNDWLSVWVGLQLRNQLGLPLVHTSWAIGALKYLCLETSKMMSIRHSVEWTCLEQADCVVAGSPQEVADLRQLMSICGQSKVIPCGIDTQHFGAYTQTSARQRLGISPETHLILYVGQFAPLKGIETLIKACASLPKPFLLYLVSDSSEDKVNFQEEQNIRTLVKQMDLDKWVVFTGAVSRSRLPAYYAAADVCVVPSYYEASGSISLESMASGTPVIASAELRYFVRHCQTGLLITPFDPDTLASALWDALAYPSRWYAYGLAGQYWVKSRFSYAAVSTQMHDLYRTLTMTGVVKASHSPKHPAPMLGRKLHGCLKRQTLSGTNFSMGQNHHRLV
jgi:D-inositol-3-phosphate glycosyltransferase